MSRIGLLFPTSLSDPRTPRFLEAFRQGLRDLGYAEGQNIVLESRFADGKWDRLPDLAAELIRVKVDVIVTYTTPAAQAAKQATGAIPIVVAAVIDPVATGLVASLARPGGNITGLSQMVPELEAVGGAQGSCPEDLAGSRAREPGQLWQRNTGTTRAGCGPGTRDPATTPGGEWPQRDR